MLEKIKNVSKKILFKKDGGASQLIIEIGLVVVAVFFIVIFRTQLNTLFTEVFNTASGTIKGLFTSSTPVT